MPVILGKSLHALQLRLARAHTLNCSAYGTSTILVGTTLFGREGAKSQKREHMSGPEV